MSRAHINKQSSPISCGILELGNLQSEAHKSAWEIAHSFYHPAFANPETFLMISDSAKDVRSKDFVAFFVGKGLASLTETPTMLNPKSGTAIKVWILTVDHAEFRKWYAEEAASRIKRGV